MTESCFSIQSHTKNHELVTEEFILSILACKQKWKIISAPWFRCAPKCDGFFLVQCYKPPPSFMKIGARSFSVILLTNRQTKPNMTSLVALMKFVGYLEKKKKQPKKTKVCIYYQSRRYCSVTSYKKGRKVTQRSWMDDSLTNFSSALNAGIQIPSPTKSKCVFSCLNTDILLFFCGIGTTTCCHRRWCIFSTSALRCDPNLTSKYSSFHIQA